MIRDTCRSLGQLLVFVGFWAFLFGFIAGAIGAYEAVWLIFGGIGSAVIGLILGALAEIPGWIGRHHQRKTVPNAPLPLVGLRSAGSIRWRSVRYRRPSRRKIF